MCSDIEMFRSHKECRTYIETYSGEEIDLMDPDISKVHINDIAHHLALENRYNGGTLWPVSVAQHSVIVASFCEDQYKRQGLLHDAEEYIYKDLTRPLKTALMQIGDGYNDYKWVCQCFTKKVFQKFGIFTTEASDIAVKHADNLACLLEARTAMRSMGEKWDWGTYSLPEGMKICQMTWVEAKEAFLDAYNQLWGLTPRTWLDEANPIYR